MHKRSFLAAAAGAALAPAALAQAPHPVRGPILLTVSGAAVTRPNRGPLDPVLDQFMSKQKLAFERARAFDFHALVNLPAVTIRPTLEYDGKKHALRGPLLLHVLRAAGVKDDAAQLVLRAIDGYSPTLSLQDVRKFDFIVATHLDNRAIPLGGLGPLWAVYEADRFPEMAAKPVDQRFALCPWGLYHVEVKAG